jgi:hypothetical protein
LMILSARSFAEAPEADARNHFTLACGWREVKQFQKAIGEFEQAYLLDRKPGHLYFLAQSYEQLACMPTKPASEVLEAKMQALGLYETFIEKAPPGEPGLDVARSRIQPLRQEIKELAAQRTEQEASLKDLRSDIKQLVLEVRTLRELLLQWMHGDRTAVPTISVR